MPIGPPPNIEPYFNVSQSCIFSSTQLVHWSCLSWWEAPGKRSVNKRSHLTSLVFHSLQWFIIDQWFIIGQHRESVPGRQRGERRKRIASGCLKLWLSFSVVHQLQSPQRRINTASYLQAAAAWHTKEFFSGKKKIGRATTFKSRTTKLSSQAQFHSVWVRNPAGPVTRKSTE